MIQDPAHEAAKLAATTLRDLGVEAELVSASPRRIRFLVAREQIEVPIAPGVWAARPGLPAIALGITIQYLFTASTPTK